MESTTTTKKINCALLAFGKNHAIDKYYQILTLLDKMLEDSRFEFSLIFDKTTDKLISQMDEHFSRSIRILQLESTNLKDFNCVIIVNPYGQPSIKLKEFPVPIIYKEYGVSGAEVNSGYLVSRASYKFADMVITDNDYMKSIIESKYPGKFVVVGSPAFDYVLEQVSPDDRFSPEYKHVIWTPHHSIVPNEGYDKVLGGAYSTFSVYKEYISTQMLGEFPQIALHIKPHPILRSRYNYLYGNIDEFYERIISRYPGRVFIHESEDYHNLFLLSDIAMNDSISFLQEWLPTGKPMIILDECMRVPYSSYGDSLVSSAYYRSYGPTSLSFSLQMLLQGKDYQKDQRIKSADSLYIHPGSSNSKSLLDMIYERYT